MTFIPPLDSEELIRRVGRDLADSYDEELEMEIEDHHPLPGLSTGANGEAEKSYRRSYFGELFRLQAELVKLQDWVVATGQKVVILFEGRDAAGKGGAIKRITMRLNPRVCRAVALPAPNDRERTQWYFQRSPAQTVPVRGGAEDSHRSARARAPRALLPTGRAPGDARSRDLLIELRI
jgi:polyphosphate kinase 2 (PPK2 family)